MRIPTFVGINKTLNYCLYGGFSHLKVVESGNYTATALSQDF